MRDIDKNDVDISQLFKWKKEVILTDAVAGKKAKVYIRLGGDADINRARAYGYRKAGELRKNLKKEDSEDRTALLAEMDDFESKEMLVNTLLLLMVGDFYNRAVKETTLKEPVEPTTDATQEAWEKYQAEVDSYPERFQEKVREKTLEIQQAEEARLSEYSDKKLYDLYEGEVINRICGEEMQLSYYDMCVFLNTFTDEEYTTLVFKSFSDFDNLHPKLKSKLREEYQSLELGLDFLKKLPEATE